MRLLPFLLPVAVLLALCGSAGCAQRSVEPPAPAPVVADGHVFTQAEFESVPLGTTEEALVAAWGQPERKVSNPEEGVVQFVYKAAADHETTAEFWVSADTGRVVNKLLY